MSSDDTLRQTAEKQGHPRSDDASLAQAERQQALDKEETFEPSGEERLRSRTSDVGEAFRPVVNPRIVTAAYGVSWAYLVGDGASGMADNEECATTGRVRVGIDDMTGMDADTVAGVWRALRGSLRRSCNRLRSMGLPSPVSSVPPATASPSR